MKVTWQRSELLLSWLGRQGESSAPGAPEAVGLPPQEVVLRWELPPAEGGAVNESCRSVATSGVVSLAADGGGGGSRGVLGVAAACSIIQQAIICTSM